MDAQILSVRRSVILLVAGAVAAALFILVVMGPILSPSLVGMRSGWIDLLSGLILAAGMLAWFYDYLRPIADLAKVRRAGEALPSERAQKVRALVFQAPIAILAVPVALAFLLVAAFNVFGLLSTEGYAVAERLLSSFLVITVSAGLSPMTSVISWRILMPVLALTSRRTPNVGLLLSLRIITAASVLALIAVAFLGSLGILCRVQLLAAPTVSDAIPVLMGFVAAAYLVVLAANLHLAEDFRRDAECFESHSNQVTELIRTVTTLVDERSRSDAILRNIADGLLVSDPEDVIVLVNPVFERMFGQPASVLVGRPLAQAISARELPQLITNALEDRTASFTTDIPMPDKRIFKASAAAMQEGARVLGVVTVIRDVTAEKEVDRMKTEFISTVSHELRTPLTSILGFAKLVGRTLDKDIAPHIAPHNKSTRRTLERMQNNLNIIVVEAERLTRLINDVLDIARMESGAVEWRDRPFDLVSLITNEVRSLQKLAQEKGLSLEVALPPPTQLVADPDRIHQVLDNLISNAIKFTEQGTITVSARQVASGEIVHGWQAPATSGGGVLCSVADTGVGIPPEALPRLFQHFQQIVTDALTEKPTGTGLGLAVCHEIVMHYGGTLWAESTENVGSTFYFVLPLQPAAAQAAADASTTAGVRPRVGTAASLSKDESPLLLIVDDEVHIRSLLSQELETTGYRVLEAASGTEALALARHHVPSPSLILLDVVLPDISGFDVVRILKADPITASIPILIVSIVEDREQGLSLGADDYLLKPVETSTLLKSVAALLEQRADPAEQSP